MIAPPVVLPGGNEACIADSAGVVSLLTIQADGSLAVQRQWTLKGRITAGPFVRIQDETPHLGGAIGCVLPALRRVVQEKDSGLRIGCIVDHKRLVWLDPRKDTIGWEFVAAGAIIGQPQLADDRVVLADQSGRYTALEPHTGKSAGQGFALRGSIAPATAPISFGPGRLFAPLSDGTVLMLPID